MSKNKIEVDGFLPKGTECEYTEYCTRSGVRCLHSGENKRINYHCGYCKAFRFIDASRKLKNEPTILENLRKNPQSTRSNF